MTSSRLPLSMEDPVLWVTVTASAWRLRPAAAVISNARQANGRQPLTRARRANGGFGDPHLQRAPLLRPPHQPHTEMPSPPAYTPLATRDADDKAPLANESPSSECTATLPPKLADEAARTKVESASSNDSDADDRFYGADQPTRGAAARAALCTAFVAVVALSVVGFALCGSDGIAAISRAAGCGGGGSRVQQQEGGGAQGHQWAKRQADAEESTTGKEEFSTTTYLGDVTTYVKTTRPIVNPGCVCSVAFAQRLATLRRASACPCHSDGARTDTRHSYTQRLHVRHPYGLRPRPDDDGCLVEPRQFVLGGLVRVGGAERVLLPLRDVSPVDDDLDRDLERERRRLVGAVRERFACTGRARALGLARSRGRRRLRRVLLDDVRARSSPCQARRGARARVGFRRRRRAPAAPPWRGL